MPWFDESWTSGADLLVKDAIIIMWLPPIVFGISAGLVGVVKYVQILRDVLFRPPRNGVRAPAPTSANSTERRSPLIATIPVAREGLRPLASFSLWVGFAWTFGLIVWIVVTSPATFDRTETVLVGSFAVMGFLLVFVPQWMIHIALERRRAELVVPLVEQITRHLASTAGSSAIAAPGEEVTELEDRFRDLTRESTWVHATTLSGLFVLFGQVALPAASLALTILLRRDS